MKLPYFIKAVIFRYLLLLLFFTLFRVIFLFANYSLTPTYSSGQLLYAFFTGLRFDIVICGYLNALPFLIDFINSFLNYRRLSLISHTVFLLLSSLALFIINADIPYFHHYFNRITLAALNWTDNVGFMLQMILEEFSYLLYFISFIISTVMLIKLYQRYHPDFFSETTVSSLKQAGWFILAGGLMFVGIRGRLAQKSPIRIGTAYFCDNMFYNQLGLNPVFTFMESYFQYLNNENQTIYLSDGKQAVKQAQKLLNRVPVSPEYPLAEKVFFHDSLARKKNVVILILESLSADYLSYFGNTKKLTPFLDSLIFKSYFFDSTFTAGTHTFNGIYSTLTGWPGLLSNHPMNTPEIHKFNGLATELKKHGYYTYYFTTHDQEFDNVGGFLSYNDFDKIVSQKDYPSQAVKSTLGVLDHFLFDHIIETLSQSARKPFFAAVMTAANHKPYTLPDTTVFKSRFTDKNDQIVEYEDWALKRFFRLASQQAWFKNTLFVLVADHGHFFSSTYAMPLSLNHSPLYFFDPENISPRIFHKPAMQLDIPETVLSYLKLSHINNTFGIDLLTQNRPFAYFVQDDKIGVINRRYYLMLPFNNQTQLIDLKTNQSIKNKHLTDSLAQYAKIMLQSARQLIIERKNYFKE